MNYNAFKSGTDIRGVASPHGGVHYRYHRDYKNVYTKP